MLTITKVAVAKILTFMFSKFDISNFKLYCRTLNTEIEGLAL
jgi:hypothetical protein